MLRKALTNEHCDGIGSVGDELGGRGADSARAVEVRDAADVLEAIGFSHASDPKLFERLRAICDGLRGNRGRRGGGSSAAFS